MTRISRFVVCASVLYLCSATRVAADPVRITNGFLVVTGQAEVAPVAVTGTRGFSVLGLVDPGEGRIDAFTDCTPCTPGTPISLGGFLAGAFIADVALDGNDYHLTTGINDPSSMVWEFSASTTAPAGHRGFELLQAPFVLTGSFIKDVGEPPVPLSAHGTASLLLRSAAISPDDVISLDNPLLWETDLVHYDFEDVAATPEPASLTLLGLGMAMAGVRRMRRTMRQSS